MHRGVAAQALTIVTLMASVAGRLPAQNQPIQHPIAVADVGPEHLGTDWPGWFEWLDDTAILLYRDTETTLTGAKVIRPAEFTRYDTRSHKRERLSNLEVCFARAGSCTAPMLSPDRKSLLWYPRGMLRPGVKFGAAIDGSHYFEWNAEYAGTIWAADSQSWAEIVDVTSSGNFDLDIVGTAAPLTHRNLDKDYVVLLHQLKSPEVTHKLKTTLPEAIAPHGLFGELQLLSNGHILVNITGLGDQFEEINLAELEPGRTFAVVSQYSIKMPPNESIDDLVYDIAHKRIAWLVSSSRRLGPSGDEQMYHSLWTSKLDGSEMSKVYSVPTGPGTYPDRQGAISQVKWLPSGTRISFVRGGKLWVVDAINR